MKFTEYLTLTEGVNDPAIFKVIFLAGGPGSGKSFAAKQTAFKSMGFTVINSDDAFEHMMRKGGLDFKMPESQKTERDAVRDKAKATIDKKQQLAIQGRLGMVIDGTGRDADKIMKLKAKFEEQGYEAAMMFVNTDLDTALKRNKARERSVPDDMAKKLWTDVQGNIGAFQHEFGKNFHVVDNSEGADFEEHTMRVFKDVGKWAKQAPKSPEAKKWIADNSPKGAATETEKPAAKEAPAAVDKTAATAPTKAAPAPAAAPAAPQGGEKPDGVKEPYKIKCVDKRPPHQVKIANVNADTEEEALKIVRHHGYTPMEVNGRALRESFMSVMEETTCDIISMQQLKDLEKFGDRLLQKFDIDVEFTKHFGERMSDARNKPCIKVSELQSLFKKISKDKGSKVKQHADHEAVLKDIQSDLNLPFIAKPTKDGEIDLVLKTIMRKKDFKSPDPEVRYEESDVPSTEYLSESEYQGKNVELNKPFRTPGGPKKFAVYVKNDAGNVVIVRFGDPNMEIKRDDPDRRASFRARHNCSDAKDRTTPRYWSCYQWRAGAKVEESVESLLEYPSDLAKMKKSDSYKVGDNVMVKAGGRWNRGVISKPKNSAGNYGVKFKYKDNKTTTDYLASTDELRLYVEEAAEMKDEDPCWKDYEMVGTKKKNGKTVPNCVPKESYDDVCPECEEQPCVCGNGLIDESIIQVGDKWKLVSKSTGKNLGTFDTKAEAEKHEREVQFFKHQNEETVMEGRPSQRHPLEGHPYHSKTDAELTFIGKDAHKAAQAMRGHNTDAENKYMDQANDAATVRYWRQKNGTPDWYKKKYGIKKESVEMPLYVQEAAYAGNIGMMELVKFYQKCTESEKKHLQDLIKKGMAKEAWKLVQDKTGTQLVGKEFHEEFQIDEGKIDKSHPIAKEYDAMKKLDIKAIRGMLRQQGRISDTSEYRTKDHAISTYLRNKHGNKKVDQVFGFSEDVAVAANSVSGGGVDMNPTGKPKWDKRSKFHIDHMFRRADGTKYGKKKSLNEKD